MGNRLYRCFGHSTGSIVIDDTEQMTDAILKQRAMPALFSERDFATIGNPKRKDEDRTEV
jgi:hypothetical protein